MAFNEKKIPEKNEVHTILGDIENYYRDFFGEDGFLGYCLRCDSYTFISEEYPVFESYDGKQFFATEKGNLECALCGGSEKSLFNISPNNILELYNIYQKKTPEKIKEMVDEWREKNDFPQSLDYHFESGEKLAKDFSRWDSMREKKKYEEVANLIVDQWKFLNNKSSSLKSMKKKTLPDKISQQR